MKKLFVIFFVLLFSTNAYALKFVNCYFIKSKDTTFDKSKFNKKNFEKYEYVFYSKQNKVSRIIVRTDSFLEELKKKWEKRRQSFKKKFPGEDLGAYNHERISNEVFNIKLYDETYIKAEKFKQSDITDLAATKYQLVFNLKKGQVEITDDLQIRGKSTVINNSILQCQIKKGKSKSNYLDYWWAVILIIAITFFIFTQSGKRLKKIRRK